MMSQTPCCILTLTFLLFASQALAQTTPLWRAHAHNDYAHERPLQEALERGIGSVEVDIHLVDGQLLVAHDLDKVEQGKSLENMYLTPLQVHIRANGGNVYSENGSLILLIDIKSDAQATYAVLRNVLKDYGDIMTRFEGELTIAGAVTAIISGNRPREMMLAEEVRWAAFDGRLEDLGQQDQVSVSFMPLISSNWSQIARWYGQGSFPEKAKENLMQNVKQAHDEGRKIRFWATSDNTHVWDVLYEAGVDYINADNLERVQGYLKEKQ